MKKNGGKTEKPKYLKSIPKCPSLEDLLFVMNGMKKEKMFLKKVKFDMNGNVIGCFTKKGAKLYERMFEFLKGIMMLADVPTETRDYLIGDIQETFDYIAEHEL